MRWKPSLTLLLAFAGFSHASAEVRGLSAFCREGQTFLNWQEDDSDWYYVYASSKPIKKVKSLGPQLFPRLIL